MLDSGADVSSILEPVLRKVEAYLPDVQVRSLLEEGLENDYVVTVIHKTVCFQLTVHTPWGPVVFDPALFAVMLGCDSALIFQGIMLDEL